MYSNMKTYTLQGLKAHPVQVEVDISTGLPGFAMVGSLSGEVREARERVQVALKNSGFQLPPRKITINLSPADTRKEGTAFDLPIAVGILRSLDYFPPEAAEDIIFLGELGLNGEIKPVKGILPIVREAAVQGVVCFLMSTQNAPEGAIIPGVRVYGADNLKQLLAFLQAPKESRDSILHPCPRGKTAPEAPSPGEHIPDFADVSGQESARRAAEIAAAGFHNLLLIGPPGAGKSMIARRIPGILPPLTLEESLEVSSIYSVAGLLKNAGTLITHRPFQSPHHTLSQPALIGGGTTPRPGILSLSHRGVLFLDELTEFQRTTLDAMRQPLEEHQVHIARIHGKATYPACSILVGAMNPCKCGYYPERNRCTCTESEVKQYLGKVSGPLLDRFDLSVETLPVAISSLTKIQASESTQSIRQRVCEARAIQQKRYSGTSIQFNGEIDASNISRFCFLGESQQKLMEQAYQSMGLSARAYHRILKVARTIADLAREEHITEEHLTEALYYKTADSTYWGK